MSFITEKKFDSLEEMLDHLRSVVEQAEAAQPPEDDDGIEVGDFDLRRAVVKTVIDRIEFNSPEEFVKYVEFIYGFMADSED